MATVKITLKDDPAGSGNVLIISDPPMHKLVALRKAKETTPAQGYAIIGLATVVQVSMNEAKEQFRKRVIMPKEESFTLPPEPKISH